MQAVAGHQSWEFAKAALVDLDSSSIFMLLVFLLLWFVLNKTFLQPMLQVLDKRHALTDGAREEANRAVKEAEQRIAEYESQVGEARRNSVAEQKKLRIESLARERELLAAVRKEADAQIAAGIGDLQDSAASIESEFKAQSAALGQKIVARVMGAA